MMKVLITDSITEQGIALLKDADLDVLNMSEVPEEEWHKHLGEIQGWIIRSGTRVDAEKLDRADQLQVVGRAGVGVDNIDIPTATRKGIVVMNTPDVNTVSAAEHSIGMMLALARNISRGHRDLMKGEWNRQKLIGSELRNKVLGIVGLGKIGREVMTRCRAFGMRILGYDPYLSPEMFNPEDVTLVDLDTLTRQADMITIHVPLMDSTRGLFNLDRLKMMQPTAQIINVARGGIIHEEDLAVALKEGIIAGAAIDVFVQEPIPADHPLLNIENCVLTPHLGASTQEAKEGVSIAICTQVRDYLVEEKLSNALNMPIADMNKLAQIKPYLDLAELLGKIQAQVCPRSVSTVHLECAGNIEEVKLMALAFAKGLLAKRVPERLNYINAETLAKERGIHIDVNYTSESGTYSNLVSSRVTSDEGVSQIDGSVFQGNRLRIVNFFGYEEMDVTPVGTILLIRNQDVPGVIGKVGTLLGNADINIGAYLLSRKNSEGEAFAVVRVDSTLPEDLVETLQGLPEITDVKQIDC